MSHPLIGHPVRVNPGMPPRVVDRSFDGVVMDVLDGNLLVMRTDDGSLGAWSAEYVTFTDPDRAARVLRAHATDNDFRAAGCTIVPEYTPPRWVPAVDVLAGAPILACKQPSGKIVAAPHGQKWEAIDVELVQDPAILGLLILVGEWPPLPKVPA